MQPKWDNNSTSENSKNTSSFSDDNQASFTTELETECKRILTNANEFHPAGVLYAMNVLFTNRAKITIKILLSLLLNVGKSTNQKIRKNAASCLANTIVEDLTQLQQTSDILKTYDSLDFVHDFLCNIMERIPSNTIIIEIVNTVIKKTILTLQSTDISKSLKCSSVTFLSYCITYKLISKENALQIVKSIINFGKAIPNTIIQNFPTLTNAFYGDKEIMEKLLPIVSLNKESLLYLLGEEYRIYTAYSMFNKTNPKLRPADLPKPEGYIIKYAKEIVQDLINEISHREHNKQIDSYTPASTDLSYIFAIAPKIAFPEIKAFFFKNIKGSEGRRSRAFMTASAVSTPRLTIDDTTESELMNFFNKVVDAIFESTKDEQSFVSATAVYAASQIARIHGSQTLWIELARSINRPTRQSREMHVARVALMQTLVEVHGANCFDRLLHDWGLALAEHIAFKTRFPRAPLAPLAGQVVAAAAADGFDATRLIDCSRVLLLASKQVAGLCQLAAFYSPYGHLADRFAETLIQKISSTQNQAGDTKEASIAALTALVSSMSAADLLKMYECNRGHTSLALLSDVKDDCELCAAVFLAIAVLRKFGKECDKVATIKDEFSQQWLKLPSGSISYVVGNAALGVYAPCKETEGCLERAREVFKDVKGSWGNSHWSVALHATAVRLLKPDDSLDIMDSICRYVFMKNISGCESSVLEALSDLSSSGKKLQNYSILYLLALRKQREFRTAANNILKEYDM